MDKVSILVAVYNAEPYLRACLDSLISQTYRDIEIMCIDDCSTDSSPSILYEYSQRDPRINVITLNENQGQAHARNIGLAQTTGNLVCMLDADDWFASDAIEQAVSVFKQHSETDTVLFDVVMEYPGKQERYTMPGFVSLTGEEAFRMSLSWKIHGLYMVKAEIHRKWPYDETCRLYSDDNTTRIHYLASREVRRCNGIYHYRQHEASATHAVSGKRFDYIKAAETMKRQMVAMGVRPELLAEYEKQRWLILIDTYLFYHCHGSMLSPQERVYGLSEMKRAWTNIDYSLLPRPLTAKFGYMPTKAWWLFRLQEWGYFTIRGILGKNKEQCSTAN